jgi:hypothetical protein
VTMLSALKVLVNGGFIVMIKQGQNRPTHVRNCMNSLNDCVVFEKKAYLNLKIYKDKGLDGKIRRTNPKFRLSRHCPSN